MTRAKGQFTVRVGLEEHEVRWSASLRSKFRIRRRQSRCTSVCSVSRRVPTVRPRFWRSVLASSLPHFMKSKLASLSFPTGPNSLATESLAKRKQKAKRF